MCVQVLQIQTCDMTMGLPNNEQKGKPIEGLRTPTRHPGHWPPVKISALATCPFQNSPSVTLGVGATSPALRDTCLGCKYTWQVTSQGVMSFVAGDSFLSVSSMERLSG